MKNAKTICHYVFTSILVIAVAIDLFGCGKASSKEESESTNIETVDEVESIQRGIKCNVVKKEILEVESRRKVYCVTFCQKMGVFEIQTAVPKSIFDILEGGEDVTLDLKYVTSTYYCTNEDPCSLTHTTCIVYEIYRDGRAIYVSEPYDNGEYNNKQEEG